MIMIGPGVRPSFSSTGVFRWFDGPDVPKSDDPTSSRRQKFWRAIVSRTATLGTRWGVHLAAQRGREITTAFEALRTYASEPTWATPPVLTPTGLQPRQTPAVQRGPAL